jgi:hypothetical protein
MPTKKRVWDGKPTKVQPKPPTPEAIEKSALMSAQGTILANRALIIAAIVDELPLDHHAAAASVSTVTRAIRHILLDGFKPKRGG